MSTKVINTRIKLRVDTAENWAAHDGSTGKEGVKIYKGEAALSLQSGTNAGKYEIRYGTSDEGSYWKDLSSGNFLVPAANVTGLLDALYDWQLVQSAEAGTYTIKLQKKLQSASEWTDVTTVNLKTTSGTYSDSNPFALKDYVDTAVAGATTQYFESVRGTVTEGTTTRPETDTEVITRYFTEHTGITVKGGSTFVIKTAIGSTGKYEYIAFTYDTTTDSANPVWRAMDGNYNAENVYFSSNIIATYEWGQYKPDSTGSVTIPANGKNVVELFDDVLSKEVQGSITTQSSASLASTGNFKNYEVGSMTDTLSFTLSTNKGAYKYGPSDTEVTFSDFKVNFNGSQLTEAGTFDSFRVTDTTNLTLSGTYDASQGANALTNKGNQSSPEVRIAAKSDVALGGSKTVKGFRYTFYGPVSSKDTITSSVIRGLTGKTTSALSNTTIAVGGSYRVIIAIPQARPSGAPTDSYNIYNGDYLTSVLDENDSKANINKSFTKITVQVNDANGENPINYSVYYIDFANAHATDNFIVTQ